MPRVVRYIDVPPSLFGWSGIPSLEKISIDIQIVLTERGAGRVKSVEVIKVMHQKGDMVVSLGYPVHKVCYTCEDIWSSPDAERREHIDIKSTTPFHTQQPAILFMDCPDIFIHSITFKSLSPS